MKKLDQWPSCPHRALECGTPSDGAVGSPELPEVQLLSLLELREVGAPQGHTAGVRQSSAYNLCWFKP